MKLLKNTLTNLNNTIGFNNFNSEQFEWNKQPGGLFDDNRMKIITKPMIENKPQSFEKGDKMKIPGVLDYTGAKYPFKKKKKKKLIGKHQPGGQFLQNNMQRNTWYVNPETYMIDNIGDNIYNGGDIVFDEYSTTYTNPNKSVYTNDKDELVVQSSPLDRKAVEKIRKLIPDEQSREHLYQLLDPKNPAYFPTIPGDYKMRKNLNDNLNNRLRKLAYIYDLCGDSVADTRDKNPHYGGIISGNRPHVDRKNGKTILYMRDNKEWHTDSIISELAHAFQLNTKVSKKFGMDRSLAGLIGGDIKDFNGISGYDRFGHAENEAHAILEPAFRDFIFDPKYKNAKDLGNLIKKYTINAKQNYEKLVKQSMSDRIESMKSTSGIIMDKSGSKIHIKKKNRGKFTDYCGGTVTQDCINRAKHSGNKTLIKRSVFAENARKWKH